MKPNIFFKATAINVRNLKPGDVFSTLGPEYWTDVMQTSRSLAEKVYVRTTLAPPIDQLDDIVYLITWVVQE